MNLIKWDPFRDMEEVSSRLNRIFGRPQARTETGQEMLRMADWAPPVDISETDTAYQVMAEIPGVNKENVKVTIQDGMLTIQGERRQENEGKGKKFHHIERSYGSFARSFHMPGDANEDSVKAEFKDGMLNITLAKSVKAKPKAIEVSIA